MSDRIKTVTPTNVALFTAAKWMGLEDDEAICEMAERFGWDIRGTTPVRRGGVFPGLVILGRNKKRYTVLTGEWVIALGTNGSLRVCSDATYKRDYREVSG